MELFLKGIVAGFIVAVPLGPVSILCFRRILTGTLLAGIVTVVGAALADSIYGVVAAFGLRAVTRALLTHRAPLRIAGGIFLLWLGLAMFRFKERAEGADRAATRNLAGSFFSAFLLMLANPTIIISFLAVFAAIDLGAEQGLLRHGPLLGSGVFLGSAAWWGIYKALSLPFRGKVASRELRLINLSAGSLICAFGLWQLLDLIRGK